MAKAISLNFDPPSKHSIATILAELAPDELERLAVDIVREQRRRIEHAQLLYERLEATDEQSPGAEARSELRHEYRLALVMMKGHHQVAATVLDTLGYVPSLPEDENPGRRN